MVRKKKPPTINVKMYRNFAIATVLLTGSLALIADGDKREAIAQEVSNIKIEAPKKPEGALIIKNDQVSGGGDLSGFYAEAGGGVSSMAGISSSVSGNFLTMENVSSPHGLKQLARAGMTIEQYNALSEAEKRKLLAALNGGESPAERERAIRNASDASLARSGGGESADY